MPLNDSTFGMSPVDESRSRYGRNVSAAISELEFGDESTVDENTELASSISFECVYANSR